MRGYRDRYVKNSEDAGKDGYRSDDTTGGGHRHTHSTSRQGVDKGYRRRRRTDITGFQRAHRS